MKKDVLQTLQNELVIYHNDFNKIILPEFSANEHDLLISIISKIKNLGDNDIITFYPKELRKFCIKNYTNSDLSEILKQIKNKIYDKDLRYILSDEKQQCYKDITLRLFDTFEITYKEPKRIILNNLKLKVNKEFSYLVNNLTKNFTTFELVEFLLLRSKYSKNLYRLLKQYKDTGKLTIYKNKWEEFTEYMNIPYSYNQSDIDKLILKPAIKELSNKFKDLNYKKIKNKNTKGQGGSVIGIEFHFNTKENI